MILCIETATPVCSVCLSDKGIPVILRESTRLRDHASRLTLFIEEVLAEARIRAGDLDMIAVSMGPGSYTGLRIGVSVAKGLSYGAGVPMAGISTLKALAQGALNLPQVREKKESCPGQHILVPMIDARRLEVYTARYTRRLKTLKEPHALVVESGSFRELPEDRILFFGGDGAGKCRKLITHPGAVFLDQLHASAGHLAPLAGELFEKKEFADTAYFEPFYLKDFIPTVPRNKLR
ncbi:MAG TPA: tRNA (adenosine(37)-N6)-threonylcarbamoyltransferase complex dimerization subunit type 1 TsaB [Bacteroidetes bacterium]|nr:tRNA (adenosine(37)-N6)-threonylcarbamoyltransferase complex dimerization subunit type 1 TsaB [Bacteroidota bacterium]